MNIFGGFVVSQRMLDLFKKPGDKDYTGAGEVTAGFLGDWGSTGGCLDENLGDGWDMF